MSKRKGPTPRVARWGPWGEDVRSPTPDGTRIFGNGWWTVHVRRLDGRNEPADLADALHLSIHDRPRSTRHDWREFQRIKTELVGPEREAVELYPAESRLLDTSNEYHLWVMPEGEKIEIGWDLGRPITEEDVKNLPTEEIEKTYAGLGVRSDERGRARQRPRRDR